MRGSWLLLRAALSMAIVWPAAGQSQDVGAVVSGFIPISEARGEDIVAKVPLPPGPWEVIDSRPRRSIGNEAADLREVRLIQLANEGEGPVLHSAIEITMKVGGPNIAWNDEPCKRTPVLAKNDYGTGLFKQKCLTLISDSFLQNNNRVTQQMLADFAKRGVRHDFNSLALTYTRYGDFGYFLIVTQHLFPSRYGQGNPRIAIANESPWHPSRVNTDPQRKRLVDAIFTYGEKAANAYDQAYFRKDPLPIEELRLE